MNSYVTEDGLYRVFPDSKPMTIFYNSLVGPYEKEPEWPKCFLDYCAWFSLACAVVFVMTVTFGFVHAPKLPPETPVTTTASVR